MKIKVKIGLLAALLILPVSLLAQPQPKQPNFFQKGKEHFNQQEYDAAIQDLQKFLKSTQAQGKGGPQIPPQRKAEANYLIGMSYLKKSSGEAKFYDQAAASLTKAIELKPDYLAAKAARGTVRMEQKQYALAVEDLQAVVTAQPGNIEAWNHLGIAYSWLNQHQNAIEALKKVVAADPQNAYAHYYLGVAYSKMKEFGMLETHWKRFLELCPDCPEAAQVRDFLKRT
jgi:tetratricopeptide (TPR) repeat protein